ncbi:MAG TPA: hypothetical protein VGM82_03670 [Gemmatimonadaceae bacterium]
MDRPPWSALSHADRVDHLPPLLRKLIDWAFCSPTEQTQARAFIDAASEHGVQRRALDLEYDVIMEESAVLRRAIWEVAAPSFEERANMIKIDSALTVGLMASLRGYAKPELTRDGKWETSLTRIAGEWSDVLSR